MLQFQVNDPTLESQWRAIILFGKNSATYKFAFAQALIEFTQQKKTEVALAELSEPFSRHICNHLKKSDRQGTAERSRFLDTCRKFNQGEISKDRLLKVTQSLGFVNVVDAFQVVNRDMIPNPFYEKNYQEGDKRIIIRDELFKLAEGFQFTNLSGEADARWDLVETAWNLDINPRLLEIQFDEIRNEFFVEENFQNRRVNVTSARESLNGYQKGKCFYCYRDISIVSGDDNLCEVDHFLPHSHVNEHYPANINGVWNLVLSCRECNGLSGKGARTPDLDYLDALFQRNEFYIESKHPLAETIVNQTGSSQEKRKHFLQYHYNVSANCSIHKWEPGFLFSTRPF